MRIILLPFLLLSSISFSSAFLLPTFLVHLPSLASSSSSSSTRDDRDIGPPLATNTALSKTKSKEDSFIIPKQSLGQNFLWCEDTIAKVIRSFEKDVASTKLSNSPTVVELGPGQGALTSPLFKTYGLKSLTAVELDDRFVPILHSKFPGINIISSDCLKVNYTSLSIDKGGSPLSIIGNLPYYISSQILFTLADASHFNSVSSATVMVQLEVGKRVCSPPANQPKNHNVFLKATGGDYGSKDYGILSVVFSMYTAEPASRHFDVQPDRFTPIPKVTSTLISLKFIGPEGLRRRLAGVKIDDFRRVLKAAFGMRRKRVGNSLKDLVLQVCDGDKDKVTEIMRQGASIPAPRLPPYAEADAKSCDYFALNQRLPAEGKVWGMRAEELWAGQFIELTRMIFGEEEKECMEGLGEGVWRRMKGGGDNEEAEDEPLPKRSTPAKYRKALGKEEIEARMAKAVSKRRRKAAALTESDEYSKSC